MRDKFLKARFSPEEYERLVNLADTAGMNLSEFTRTLVMRESEAITIEGALSRIETTLAQNSTPPSSSNTKDNLLLVEVLFLLRELIAEKNVQILGRVSQKMDAKFGQGRERI